jgi:hypothetical protein
VGRVVFLGQLNGASLHARQRAALSQAGRYSTGRQQACQLGLDSRLQQGPLPVRNVNAIQDQPFNVHLRVHVTAFHFLQRPQVITLDLSFPRVFGESLGDGRLQPDSVICAGSRRSVPREFTF